jgi:hypothetical protein
VAETKHDPSKVCEFDSCPFDLHEGHLIGDHPTLVDVLQSMGKGAPPEPTGEIADLRHEIETLEWRIEEKENDIASLSSALAKAEDLADKHGKDYFEAQSNYVTANDKLEHCRKALAIIVQASKGDDDGAMARGIAAEALDAIDAI